MTLIDVSTLMFFKKKNIFITKDRVYIFDILEKLLYDLLKSVSADEGHDILSSLIFISFFSILIFNISLASFPYITTASELDSLLISIDTVLVCLGGTVLFFPALFLKSFNNSLS
jgi:hypothetical protein